MKIRTAVVGVGNCFAGLYQGIEYYKRTGNTVIGIMHEHIGPYSWKDIEFVAAFDVSKHKVGKDLTEAQYAKPNMVEYIKDMPKSSVIVKESPRLDGVGKYVEDWFDPIEQTKSIDELRKDIIQEIKDKEVSVIVNYLPVGSQKAVEFWASIALETKCAFVNCMPIFIASNPEWHQRFKDAGVPVIGDDIKSQVGATILHRVLAKICDDRGAVIQKTYQLNVGGNTDFKNMLERERLITKKISKTESVQSQLSKRIDDENIYIGPSDFVPFLKNRKLCFLRIEANSWANVPFSIELRLDVDDKANSGGIVVDAIRLAQLALERNIGGSIDAASAYLMKHPRIQMSDSEARRELERFISDYEKEFAVPIGAYIIRENYLAGKSEKDRMIMEMTVKELSKRGHKINELTINHLDSLEGRKVLLCMAREKEHLTKIKEVCDKYNIKVINNPEAIMGVLDRKETYEKLIENNFLVPEFEVKSLDDISYEGKKIVTRLPDRHEMTYVIQSESDLRDAKKRYAEGGHNKILVQRYVSGENVHFYAAGEKVFLPEDAQNRSYTKKLEEAVINIGKVIGLKVFGGNAIVDKDNIYFVDIDDWPSMTSVRTEVAEEIANLVEKYIRSNS